MARGVWGVASLWAASVLLSCRGFLFPGPRRPSPSAAVRRLRRPVVSSPSVRQRVQQDARHGTAVFSSSSSSSSSSAAVGTTTLPALGSSTTVEELRKLKVKQLKAALGARDVRTAGMIEKEELVEALMTALKASEGFCASGLITPGKVAEVTGAELEVEIEDISTPLVVDVYARWCGPCQLMAPELEKAARELGPRARVCKLDSDLEPELSSRLNIGGLPTVLLFNNSNEVRRIEGAVMADQLVNLVDSASSAASEADEPASY